MTTKAVQRMYVGQFFQDTRPLLEMLMAYLKSVSNSIPSYERKLVSTYGMQRANYLRGTPPCVAINALIEQRI